MKVRHMVLAGCAAGTVALAGATTAMATSDPQLAVSSTATIQARVQVSVAVDVTCAPGEVEQFNWLTVEQAAGRTTTSASGYLSAASVVCDGTQHAYTVVATVPGGSAPLHGGPAVANFSLMVGTCAFVNPDGSCFFVTNSHSNTTGNIVITLR